MKLLTALLAIAGSTVLLTPGIASAQVYGSPIDPNVVIQSMSDAMGSRRNRGRWWERVEGRTTPAGGFGGSRCQTVSSFLSPDLMRCTSVGRDYMGKQIWTCC